MPAMIHSCLSSSLMKNVIYYLKLVLHEPAVFLTMFLTFSSVKFFFLNLFAFFFSV